MSVIEKCPNCKELDEALANNPKGGCATCFDSSTKVDIEPCKTCFDKYTLVKQYPNWRPKGEGKDV